MARGGAVCPTPRSPARARARTEAGPRRAAALLAPLLQVLQLLVAPLLAAVQDDEVAAEPTQEEEAEAKAPAPPKAKVRKRLQAMPYVE